jgi:hypothetical protein
MSAARRKVDLLQGMLSALLQQERQQQQQGSQHPQGRPAAAVASFATAADYKQGAAVGQIQELKLQLTAAQVLGGFNVASQSGPDCSRPLGFALLPAGRCLASRASTNGPARDLANSVSQAPVCISCPACVPCLLSFADALLNRSAKGMCPFQTQSLAAFPVLLQSKLAAAKGGMKDVCRLVMFC